MKKKALSLITVLLIFSMTFTGCTQTSGEVESNEEATSEKVVLKLGHVLNEESPFHKGAEEFARLVAERTDGNIEVKLFPSGLLGNDRELTEGMQLGTIDMAVVGTATIAGFVPRLQMFDMPFLFRDAEHAYKVLDGEIGDEILGDFEKVDIKGLSFWENGFRHLTNSTIEVKSPEDIKGFKIRVQEIPLHLDFWKEIGANPTPMAFSELYTALQQGTVDGQENPIQTIYTQKLYEVQKFLTLTNHVYAPAVIMISKSSFDKLPIEYQTILIESARETANFERDYIKDLEEKALEELPELGVIIEENPDLEAFKSSVAPIYEKYGKELEVEDLLSEIEGM
jgi:tripartite ATP-independent transporter DctP family solute receptor